MTWGSMKLGKGFGELKEAAEALIKENTCAAATKFEDAANPTAVLALIAEVEQLQGKKALCKLHEKESCLQCMWPPREKSEVAALKAEVERLTAELYEAKEFQPIGEACLSNRDTLRESLGLKLGEHLHDHVESLRKDAERYRWLRDSSESIHQFYLSTPIWFTGVKFSKENVDNTIDAAMGKGEKV